MHTTSKDRVLLPFNKKRLNDAHDLAARVLKDPWRRTTAERLLAQAVSFYRTKEVQE